MAEAERLSRAFLSALSSLAPAVPAACQQRQGGKWAAAGFYGRPLPMHAGTLHVATRAGRSLAGHGVPCRAVPSGSVCRDGATEQARRFFLAGCLAVPEETREMALRGDCEHPGLAAGVRGRRRALPVGTRGQGRAKAGPRQGHGDVLLWSLRAS